MIYLFGFLFVILFGILALGFGYAKGGGSRSDSKRFKKY